jgi:hypothetical protein
MAITTNSCKNVQMYVTNIVVTFWPISISGSLYSDYNLVQVVGMPNRDVATFIKIDYMQTRIQQLICGIIAPRIDSPILVEQVCIKPYS